MKYSCHRKLLCELSKLNAFILLGYWRSTDASILVYKYRPERTGINMYAEYTQPQLAFLALLYLDPFKPTNFIQNSIYTNFRINLTQFYINFSGQEHQI